MAFASAEYILCVVRRPLRVAGDVLGMKLEVRSVATHWDILSKRTAGAATRAALTVAYLLTVGLLLMTLLIAMLSER